MQNLLEAAQRIERLTDRDFFLRAMHDFNNELASLLMRHNIKPQEVVPPPTLDDFVPTHKKTLRERAEKVLASGGSRHHEVQGLYDQFVVVMMQYRVSSRQLETFHKRRRVA